MTVYYPQSSLVLQLVGMSGKNNERKKKEGGLGRDGVLPLSPCFFCLFICLFLSRLFFFSLVPTYRESETASRNISEKIEEEHHH